MRRASSRFVSSSCRLARGLGALDYRAIEGARQVHYLPFPRQPIVRPHRSPVGAIHQGASGRRATGARRPPCGTGQDGHAGLHARFARCDRVPGGLSACSRQRVSRRSTSTSRSPAASGVAWSRSQTSNASASATVASRKPKQARISARNRSAVRAVSSSPSPAGAGASSCSPSASITRGSTAAFEPREPAAAAEEGQQHREAEPRATVRGRGPRASGSTIRQGPRHGWSWRTGAGRWSRIDPGQRLDQRSTLDAKVAAHGCLRHAALLQTR